MLLRGLSINRRAIAKIGFLSGTSAKASVVDSAQIALGAHTGMVVGQVKKSACHLYGDGLVAIQRKEPHAGASLIIIHVGSHIQLQKP